jgi:hypothetical protein
VGNAIDLTKFTDGSGAELAHTSCMKAHTAALFHARPASIPAWAVFAWPTVLWQAPGPERTQFLHLGTRVTYSGDPICSGQTLWGDADGAQAAGLAWDWIELARGVVAMADPMAVITNVRLLGPDGGVLTAVEAAPHLNELVHALPWQCEVQRELARLGH